VTQVGGTPVSSTNKTDRNDITEILLKVVLRTINQTYIIYKNYPYIPSDDIETLQLQSFWLQF
jgi:hypothetical protein